mmetsp:Transcript_19174/g.49226  ORF Transcript_19174/g.49226 Transcript_19174/m.49226 type:complete len:216 (+) Transcript_19174:92-739(+)
MSAMSPPSITVRDSHSSRWKSLSRSTYGRAACFVRCARSSLLLGARSSRFSMGKSASSPDAWSMILTVHRKKSLSTSSTSLPATTMGSFFVGSRGSTILEKPVVMSTSVRNQPSLCSLAACWLHWNASKCTYCPSSLSASSTTAVTACSPISSMNAAIWHTSSVDMMKSRSAVLREKIQPTFFSPRKPASSSALSSSSVPRSSTRPAALPCCGGS